VIVKTKDGKQYTSHVDYPKGDPENPVSFGEAEDKFRFLAGFTLGKNKIDRIVECVKNLEKQETMEQLASLLS
jgi:2-methylcitrate dehydratase PrpD